MVLFFCGLRASRLRVLRRIVRHANAVMPCACVLLSCGFSCSGLCVFRQASQQCSPWRFAVCSALCPPYVRYRIHTCVQSEAEGRHFIVPVAGCRHVFPMMWCLCFSVWRISGWRMSVFVLFYENDVYENMSESSPEVISTIVWYMCGFHKFMYNYFCIKIFTEFYQ